MASLFNENSMMSMSSMSMSMSASMFGGWDELLPAPEFVDQDIKYICVQCHYMLHIPQQTSCGHRICKECVNRLLEDEDTEGKVVMCPAKEDGCEVLTFETIHPDFSAAREMKQLLVYCAYRAYGCDQTTTWRKFKDHYVICLHRRKPCDLCDQPCSLDKLQTHVDNDCPMVRCPCPFNCDETTQGIMRSQMNEHLEACTARLRTCIFSKVGCLFEGNIAALQVHGEDLKMHIQLLLCHVDKQQLEIEHLRRSSRQTNFEEERQNDDDEISSELIQDPASFKKNNINILKENTLLKESISSSHERLHEIEKNYEQSVSSLNDKLSELTTKYTSLVEELNEMRLSQNQIKLQDNRLENTISRLVWHYHCLSTANYDGHLIWCIHDYQHRKNDDKTRTLYSQPFHTSRHGYRMCARVYLNGEGQGRGKYVSLFFIVMQGDFDDLLQWPFRQKVTLSLIDQSGEASKRDYSETFRPDLSSSSFEKPKSSMNVATGSPLFISHEALESASSPYLKNDTIYFRVTVDIRGIISV